MHIIDFLKKLHCILHEFRLFLVKYFQQKNRICFRNYFEKQKLKNTDFTILCNTCIGGVIYHDMGLPFLSPTINMYIPAADFVKLCGNLDYYLSFPLEPVSVKGITYPVASIAGEITVYCKHFDTFENAKTAWERRKKRINRDNLFIMMVDRELVPPFSERVTKCCDVQTIQAFNELPFEHKVCFVKDFAFCQKYSSCRQVYKGNDQECVGILTDFVGYTGKRMYQYVKDWEYTQFLNKE